MERKVDIMFDLVQNYQPSNNEVYQNTEQHYSNTDTNENNTQWNNDSSNKEDIDNRIEISDDSDDDDDDDDSEEVSDSESDDEEIPKLSLAKVQDMSLSQNDVKKITVKEVPINNNIELEEVDSLDEIDDDDDDDDNDNDDDNDDDDDVDTNLSLIHI